MNVHLPASATPPVESPPVTAPPSAWTAVISNQLDLRRIYLAFLRRIRLFAAVTVSVFLAALAITLTMTPNYTANANVMLDPRKENVTNMTDVLAGLPADTTVMDTEVEVLKSRQLAERVVTALNLEADPEFNSAVRQPGVLGVVIHTVKNLFGAPSSVDNSAAARQQARDSVVDNVLGNLTIKRTGLTYVINIAFESEDPAKASKIANKYAELYLLEQLEAKFDATQQANQWLSSRLGELRNQVLGAEAAMQQYKIANNLMSAAGTNLTEAEISNYNQTLSLAQAQEAADQATLATAKRQLANGSNGEDVSEALSSPVIQQLRQQRAQISRTVAEMQGRYGDRHPEMLKAQRQLADYDSQIHDEVQRIVSSLQAKVEVSRQRVASIQGSLGGARGTLASNNRAMVKLNELERTAEASRTLYESYLNRYKETAAQQGIEAPDARIVSKAKIPLHPSSPKIVLNLALGLLLGLGAGAGSLVLAEMLDAGLATAEDVERRLDTAYLGAIPLYESVIEDTSLSPIDHVVAKPLSSFAEAFRALRTSISHSRLGENVRVVAVTSALPGEGKTTTSVCLARTAALQGLRVILIDCDLRRRTVNRMLDHEPEVGLIEVLNGEVKLADTVFTDQQTGAHFLPLAQRTFTPKDVFGTGAMERLLDSLRGEYDLVILDTAPVLPVADTRVLAPMADTVVFLARWRKTPQHAIEAGLRLFNGTGAYIGGLVLTQMDMRQQSKFGYGDPGYYYGEYKKYYLN